MTYAQACGLANQEGRLAGIRASRRPHSSDWDEWEIQQIQAVIRRLNQMLPVFQRVRLYVSADEPEFCTHPNENPAVCTCSPDCYCKTHTCRDKQ